MNTQTHTNDQRADASHATSSPDAGSRAPARLGAWIEQRITSGSVTSLLVAVVVLVALGGPTAAILAAIAAGTAAALVDLRTGRIPNGLVLVTAAAATAGVAAASVGAGWSVALGALLGVLGLAGPLLAVHLVVPAAMGFGDVKLAVALGGALGTLDPRFGLLALCVATGVTGAVGVVARRRTLPLGPGLVVGAAVAATLGSSVLP